MSGLHDVLYEAFWKAGDAIDDDDTVGYDHPYMDRAMDMIDTSGSGMPRQFWTHMADAWREACTIRTVEQLDALPHDAVVMTSERVVYQRARTPFRDWYSTVFSEVKTDEIPLPALLLWHPDWEAK